ncbi:MAG TPA: VOC family protein [Lacisediminihabitans sp.]|uniref:VOC family protein n=1 Tax=Lacisediminihabitans sp. TaxID=2787631 RepID=UPI002ED79A80
MKLQVTFDTADPNAQAAFWAALLGYQVEDNSEFVDRLVSDGRMPESDRLIRNGRSVFREVAAARDPTGEGPRLYFQLVPEGKVAKNRVHLDVPVPEETRRAEVARAEALGATLLWETDDRGTYTYTLSDPEGNEFCLH